MAHLKLKEIELTHERTLKNRDSSSSPIVIVRSVKTPAQKHDKIAQCRPRREEERVQRELTDWKDEAPPSHVEWEAARDGNHDNSDNEPDNGKAP
jgi:hypothetical protein